MNKWKYSVDQDTSTAYVTALSRVNADDVIEILSELFENNDPVNNTIWDLRNGGLSGIDPDGFKRIASVADRYAPLRTNPKTTFVVNNKMEETYINLYIFYIRDEQRDITQKGFTSVEDAEAWLGIK